VSLFVEFLSSRKNAAYKWGFIAFSALVCFLNYDRTPLDFHYEWRSEIWADKAGYYSYNPALFKYSFDAGQFPDSVDARTGYGFRLDKENGKVQTMYTYGVAFLQCPFYLIADLLAEPMGYPNDGFSLIYNWAVDAAGVCYFLLAFLLLWKFLKKYADDSAVILTLFSLFFATNLFYYVIDETGMSHVYSFFLFSAFLYLMHHTDYLKMANNIQLILAGMLTGLIVLIRPTSLIFLSSYLFLDAGNWHEIKERLKRLLIPKKLLLLSIGLILILLPQLVYWKYAHDSYIYYSYGTQGFRWLQPKILDVFFDPFNGLFIYAPFYFIVLAAFIYAFLNRIKNGLYAATIFLVISYVFSCWYDWSFGCSFGSRSYIEYSVLFAVPLVYFFKFIFGLKRYKSLIFMTLVALMSFYTMNLAYVYEDCYFGNKGDWTYYFEMVDAGLEKF
jgi:hypothetical protein